MNSLVFGILLFIFVGERVDGVKIQFFKGKNFTDLHYESNSTAKCNNVPDYEEDVWIFSIKTDTCLMVYFDPNCEDISRKFDLDNNLGWRNWVRSFHICNEDIGGPQLKIDITKYWDFSASFVLEGYRDVCSCINVPQYVQDMTRWRINNYGNDFLAYYQPDCSENKWKAEHVAAGNWCPGSNCMEEYIQTDSVTNTVYKIQSIGPNPNSKYFKSNCRQIPINSQFRAKDEQLEKQIETMLTANQALKSKIVELESNQENQHKNFEVLIGLLKDQFSKDLLNYQQTQDNKSEQIEKRMFTEIQALKNTTVELKLKMENQSKSYEDSIKKLKDDFEIFA